MCIKFSYIFLFLLQFSYVPNTENKFRNVPLKYQKFCGEKPVKNIGYAVAPTKSGKCGVLFKEFIASITSKTSSHYLFVQYISDPDSRYPNENINAGFLLRIETILKKEST